MVDASSADIMRALDHIVLDEEIRIRRLSPDLFRAAVVNVRAEAQVAHVCHRHASVAIAELADILEDPEGDHLATRDFIQRNSPRKSRP